MGDKQKVKVGVTLLEKDRSRTDKDKDTIEVLSQFFQSVYTIEPPGGVPTLLTVTDDTIVDFEFTKEEAEEVIKWIQAPFARPVSPQNST